MKPSGRCRLHGGLSPSGIASASLKHCRHSRNLPTRLAASYAEAKSDPELTALREDLALTDARLCDLLGRVDSGEAGSTWGEIGEAVACYRSAEAKGPKGEGDRAAAIDEIERLASGGKGDYAAWGEVSKMVEQRRKLAESEARRLGTLNQFITRDRAMLLVGVLVGIVRQHVQDRDTLRAISRDVGRLVGDGASGDVATADAL